MLCTVSADQTCRLWALSRVGRGPGAWREVGRPQVHGHDFTCVAFVSNDVYVSGSDEKVLRVRRGGGRAGRWVARRRDG